MKPSRFIALATWMLDHLAFGLKDEGLCGDLLEELQLGRSAAWFWRQVLSAIAIGGLNMIRELALPLAFAMGWTMLYPIWRSAGIDLFSFAIAGRWNALAWPGSALLEIGCGVTPAITFIWAGFLVYLLLRRELLRELHALQIMQGLSTSLTVLLSFTVNMLHFFGHPSHALISIARRDFYSTLHFFNVSIPLSVSLLAALLFTLSSAPRSRRRQRLSHREIHSRTVRAIQIPSS
jgi:hypothetical protein